MLNRCAFCLVGLAGFVLGSNTALAGITSYTTRATFDAASGPTDLETFNQYQKQISFETAPLNVGPFTLSAIGNSNGLNFIDPPPSRTSQFNVDGTTNAHTFTATGVSVFFTFPKPIFAFGADFAALNDSNVRTNIVVNGVSLAPPAAAGIRFFGFVSDVAFTIVEFRGVSNDNYAIDNVRFSALATVPEPATLGLASVAAGIGLTRLVCRRRRTLS